MRLLEVLAALSALAGIVTAARHVYVQAHPGFSCGFDALQPVVDGLPPAHWLPGVFKVAGPVRNGLSADSRPVAAELVAGRVRAGVHPARDEPVAQSPRRLQSALC